MKPVVRVKTLTIDGRQVGAHENKSAEYDGHIGRKHCSSGVCKMEHAGEVQA